MAVNTTVLNEIIKSALAALGYELVGCQYHVSGKYRVLRVYIDHERGITLDDCAIASRQISAVLDVEAVMKDENYTLEVSSPGLDRPLFTLEHYKRFLGSKVEITLHAPRDGRRHYKGVLQRIIDEQKIGVIVEGQEYILPIGDIKKARLVPSFS